MAGTKVDVMKGPSVGAGKSGVEFTVDLRVHSDDCLDTGWDIVQYVRQNGYEFGSEYNVGNTSINDAFLYQIDPPQFVAGSKHLWEVTCHYSPRARKSGPGPAQGAKDPTDYEPIFSVGTVSKEVPVEKAFYRGGINGPGGSNRAEITVASIGGGVSINTRVGEAADGSFSPCVGLTKIDDTWGNLKPFVPGSTIAPPVQNSANDLYNPAPTKTETNGTVTIKRSVRAAAINGTAFPVDWVNSRGCVLFSRTIVLPILPYTMKLTRWSFVEQYSKDHNLEYVDITAEFELQPSGWRLYIVDTGKVRKLRAAHVDPGTGVDNICDTKKTYYDATRTVDGVTQTVKEPDWDYLYLGDEELKGGCSRREVVRDANNEPVASPVNFNGNGQEIGYLDEETKYWTPNGPKQEPDCSIHTNPNAVISIWSIYDEIDPIPLPFFRGIIRPL